MPDLVSSTPVPELSPREFEAIRKFACKTFGLDLRPGKERLVSTRLAKNMRTGGFRSYGDYFRHVMRDESGESLITLIDSLTTNHTSFLREPEHFEYLASTVRPKHSANRPLRIWSAASSTGEE